MLKKIKKPDDSEEVKQEGFLSKLEENLVNLPVNLDQLDKSYKAYKERFDDIVGDIDKLKKLALERLLRSGHDVLTSDKYDEKNCPLCLQNIDPADLVAKLEERIVELEETKKEDRQLREAKETFSRQIDATKRVIQTSASDSQLQLAENSKRKKELEDLVKSIDKYKDTLKTSVEKDNSLIDIKELLIDRKRIDTLKNGAKNDLKAIRKARGKDPKWDAHSKIKISGHAYAQIRNLTKEQAIFEKQRDTMEEIYKRFVQAQKAALMAFLTKYSSRIDEIYQFLNPGERVEDIHLVPIEKNGDLVGLTIEYDFLDKKSTSPPHKYLSESHLNCLGITVFLTSVEAFNTNNKFVILDDVISSFDTEHRKRFADLIIEEYGDYQVILLTHERSWFDIVRNLAKQKGWNIHSVKHNDVDGTYMSEPPKGLKQDIEERLAAGSGAGVGNDARKYLENLLKRIAHNLEVKVAYQPNDTNEDRMSYELLTELKSQLKKRNCKEILSDPTIDRLIGSTNIGNKESHDYFAGMKLGDIKAFWKDIKDFENLFMCDKCESLVSVINYDSVEKRVRCRKGHLAYTWNK